MKILYALFFVFLFATNSYADIAQTVIKVTCSQEKFSVQGELVTSDQLLKMEDNLEDDTKIISDTGKHHVRCSSQGMEIRGEFDKAPKENRGQCGGVDSISFSVTIDDKSIIKNEPFYHNCMPSFYSLYIDKDELLDTFVEICGTSGIHGEPYIMEACYKLRSPWKNQEWFKAYRLPLNAKHLFIPVVIVNDE